jgi:hypothetical protein
MTPDFSELSRAKAEFKKIKARGRNFPRLSATYAK